MIFRGLGKGVRGVLKKVILNPSASLPSGLSLRVEDRTGSVKNFCSL